VNYIGIDPGASGGLAVLLADRTVAYASKLPDTEHELLTVLADYGSVQSIAIIERVWASPQMGVSSAFKFGVNVGVWRCALTACRIPFDEVTPNKWQAAMGIAQRTGKTTLARTPGTKPHVKDKNIAKRRAQALFPDVTVTHAIADALLIAEYCRRLHRGAAPTAKPAQLGIFIGKEEEAVELFAGLGEVVEAIEASAREAHTTAVVAAGNGKPRHRRH
jgi:hypothetical protein